MPRRQGTKFLGIFDRRPLIWLHYVILFSVLILGFYIGDYLFDNFQSSWIMFPWLFVWLSIGDQLIHKILGVD